MGRRGKKNVYLQVLVRASLDNIPCFQLIGSFPALLSDISSKKKIGQDEKITLASMTLKPPQKMYELSRNLRA